MTLYEEAVVQLDDRPTYEVRSLVEFLGAGRLLGPRDSARLQAARDILRQRRSRPRHLWRSITDLKSRGAHR